VHKVTLSSFDAAVGSINSFFLKREVWVPVLSMCQKSGHAGCCTPHEPHESNVRYIGQTQAKRVFNGSKDAYRQWLTNRDSHSVAA
jgi:hypothetical protein